MLNDLNLMLTVTLGCSFAMQKFSSYLCKVLDRHLFKESNCQHNVWIFILTVWSSDLYTLLMWYGVKFTSYRIKNVYKSLDQTVVVFFLKSVDTKYICYKNNFCDAFSIFYENTALIVAHNNNYWKSFTTHALMWCTWI